MIAPSPEPSVRSIDFGGRGPLLLFVHANGFPPGTYRRMLNALTQRFHVIALELRPLTSHEAPDPSCGWGQLADDYCRFLKQANISHAVGVGHSLGAVITLMAANQLPSAFSEITLIDPVVLEPWLTAALSWMPYGLRMRGGMPLKALTRTEQWASRDEAFADLRSRRAFARIDDEGLWDYVSAGTTSSEHGGAKLRYPRAWEAHIYSCVPRIWRFVDEVEVPVRVLRGQLSDQFEAHAADGWAERRPDHELVQVDGAGHLLPLERPFETASLIHRETRTRAQTASK